MTHRDKNWTPGPWAVGFRNGSNANLVMARDGADRHSDSTIAQVYGIAMHQTVSEQRDAEGMPNAHLIAAAPDLVEALEYLVNTSEKTVYGSHGNAFLPGQMKRFTLAIHQSKAAIAKAYGDTPTEGTYGETEED